MYVDRFRKARVMQKRTSLFESKMGRIILFMLVIPWCGWVLFILYRAVNPTTTPLTVSWIIQRGDRVLVLRLPTAPVEEITAFSDRSVDRYTLEPGSTHRDREIHLDQAQWDSLTDLRTYWCTKQPSFSTINVDERFYDVAIRCPNGLSFRSAHIPIDELSEALADLVQHVPITILR
jgi:hypothetical protein